MLPSPFDFEEQAVLYVPAAHARAALAGVRGAGGRRDRAPPRDQPRPRLRPLHVLREHERGGGARGRPRRLPAPDPGRGAEGGRCSRPSDARRAPCCFATASFWQGVDVVGEQLSCVIIDKLPFASPGGSRGGGAHRPAAQPRRQPVRRVPGAGGDPHAEAGARPADPLRVATAASWPCSTAASWRSPTGAASSRACRRRASSTTSPPVAEFLGATRKGRGDPVRPARGR